MFKAANKFFRKITGLELIDRAKQEAQEAFELAEKARQLQQEALAAAEKAAKEADAALEAEKLAKMSPKERATANQEPWVAVIDTKVNVENPRNGFFELDWNEYFITQLRAAGYGADGDPEEQIVDRWFKELTYNMLEEDGHDTNRGSGFINVTHINKNQSIVS